MQHSPLSDRVITCPECLADNTVIGSDLMPHEKIFCSSCGVEVGIWADTHDRFIPLADEARKKPHHPIR